MLLDRGESGPSAFGLLEIESGRLTAAIFHDRTSLTSSEFALRPIIEDVARGNATRGK